MTSVICTSEVLRETIALLRRGGERGEERVVLWLARSTARDQAPIAEVYEPEQIADVDYFKLPPESIRRLMVHLRTTRRKVVAQIHTHPGQAFHSEADAEWAIIRHVGALSLVLPRFAEHDAIELSTGGHDLRVLCGGGMAAPAESWRRSAADGD